VYEKTLGTKQVYDGRILNVEVLDIELGDGRKSTREIIRHRGASAVLAVLPDGRFIFVKQYRKAVEREFIEVVAGVLDEGEVPAECARRELREETGYSARTLTHVGAIHPSPGYSSEMINIFFANVDPNCGAQDPDEDEYVEVLYFTSEEVNEMIQNGELTDAKTLATWLLCANMRLSGQTTKETNTES